MIISATITTKETPQIIEILQNAIEQIRQINQEVSAEYTNYEIKYDISQTDKDDMKEILALREREKLEYVSLKEIDDSVEAIISKREADANKIDA